MEEGLVAQGGRAGREQSRAANPGILAERDQEGGPCAAPLPEGVAPGGKQHLPASQRGTTSAPHLCPNPFIFLPPVPACPPPHTHTCAYTWV